MAKFSGFVVALRKHSKVVFIDILGFNTFDTVYKLVGKEHLINALNELNVDSFLEVSVRRQEGADTYLIEKVHYLKVNTLGRSSDDLKDRKSLSSHRFLTLRGLETRRLCGLVAKSLDVIRAFFKRRGFLECRTPILTAPSQEGARNYLVRSRLHPGKCYALAQSPQLYKQMLVYSGFNYYQLAPCFRDEDGRLDRVNGEFYQVDVECKTVTLSALLSLQKGLIFKLARQFKLKVAFLPKLRYSDAMSKYATDKPNLSYSDYPSRTQCDYFNGIKKAKVEVGELAEQHVDIFAYFIYDVPMFETDTDGKLTYFANPFGDYRLNSRYPITSKSYQFDLVINGVEISSGGMRNTDPQKLLNTFHKLGVDVNSYKHLVEALSCGVPRHGGFGMGFERLVSLIATKLLGKEVTPNEVVMFPLNDYKREPVTEAPGEYHV